MVARMLNDRSSTMSLLATRRSGRPRELVGHGPSAAEMEQILVDADQRDDEATARDVASDKREMVADLKAFLDQDEAYAGLDERRASAMDRSQAKGDREASAQDRADLTRPDVDPDPGREPARAP